MQESSVPVPKVGYLSSSDDIGLFFDYMNREELVFNLTRLSSSDLCGLLLKLLSRIEVESVELVVLIWHLTHRLSCGQWDRFLREMGCESGGYEDGLHQRLSMFCEGREHVVLDVMKDRAMLLMEQGCAQYFPVGAWCHEEQCVVCFDQVTCTRRVCCGAVVCDTCLQSHLLTQLNSGHLQMFCPANNCDQCLVKLEINFHLGEQDAERYRRYLDAASQSPDRKTCPQCSMVVQVSQKMLHKVSKGQSVLMKCSNCSLTWCFTCHSPQHPGLTCTQHQDSDFLLREWANTCRQQGERNARKCPKCKFYIERTSGCDHMTCSRCKTDFCYACGRRRRSMALIGLHHHRFSILGCSKNLLPRRPHLRRAVRGSIFTCVLLGGIVAAPVVLTVGAVGISIYKLYKLVRDY